jgi:hypothetical protein
MAGAAMTLVWRYWPGVVEQPETALIKPSDGGSSGAVSARRPQLRTADARHRVKVIASALPSAISLSMLHVPRSGTDRMTLPDIQGSGWNGGHGSGIVRGEGTDGWGTGSGTGAMINLCCEKRRPPAAAQNASPLTNAVIVLDLSGSVRQSRPVIERELREGLSRLTAGTPFNVVCFARRAVSFAPLKVPATPGNKGAAIAFVKRLLRDPAPVGGSDDSLSGSSRVDAGLLASFQNNADEVILISDGSAVVRQGNRSLTQREILARIRKGVPRDRPAPVIHTVSTSPEGSALLRRLAAEFEGEYRK